MVNDDGVVIDEEPEDKDASKVDEDFDIMNLLDEDELPGYTGDEPTTFDGAAGEDGVKDDAAKDAEPKEEHKEEPKDEPKADDKVLDKEAEGKEEPEKEPKEAGEEDVKDDKVAKEPDHAEELKAAKEQNTSLLGKMSEIVGKLMAPKAAPTKSPKAEEPEPKADDVPAKKPELIITDDEYSAAMESKEGFMALMKKVADDAAAPAPVEEAVTSVDTAATLPSAGLTSAEVEAMISQRMESVRLEAEFYQANPDLALYKPLVDLASANVNANGTTYNTTAEFFSAVEKEVRDQYGLKKPEVPIIDAGAGGEGVKKDKPAFAKAGQGTRVKVPEMDEETREMLELMDDD